VVGSGAKVNSECGHRGVALVVARVLNRTDQLQSARPPSGSVGVNWVEAIDQLVHPYVYEREHGSQVQEVVGVERGANAFWKRRDAPEKRPPLVGRRPPFAP
jgi:hypothetical protein